MCFHYNSISKVNEEFVEVQVISKSKYTELIIKALYMKRKSDFLKIIPWNINV